VAAFSRKSFQRQFRVPGLLAFAARLGGEIVGMLLWYQQGDVAYYHLGAYSQPGYDEEASFVLFPHCFDRLKRAGVRWVNLGAGAGLGADASDGLTRFKRGWTDGSRTAYLAGRIFDREKYQALSASAAPGETDFFPAYRAKTK
jgi:hypothetical protein